MSVYLDHNATTQMSPAVLESFVAWCNRGNASAEYASAAEARRMMDSFRVRIAAECAIALDGPEAYDIVFTSGASESNCAVVTSAVRSFRLKTKRKPRIVISSVEHRSLAACCDRLAYDDLAELKVVAVERDGPRFGRVSADRLKAAINADTCIVAIMAANNETGVINSLRELAAVAHAAKIPFYTDATQLLGRITFRPGAADVDAFGASFHKMGGPPGVGILALRRKFVRGYSLGPMVSGTQNGGMRGGTENLPGIGGAFTAFRAALEDRDAKAARMFRRREAIKAGLAAQLPCFYVDEHPADPPGSIDGGITPPPPPDPARAGSRAARAALAAGGPVLFWVAPHAPDWVLPNTLLVAVVRRGFCNRAARAALEARGFIVSLGSACGAREPLGRGSVPWALGLPAEMYRGLIRVSVGDETTGDEIRRFVEAFADVVASPDVVVAAPARGRGGQPEPEPARQESPSPRKDRSPAARKTPRTSPSGRKESSASRSTSPSGRKTPSASRSTSPSGRKTPSASRSTSPSGRKAPPSRSPSASPSKRKSSKARGVSASPARKASGSSRRSASESRSHKK
jgi:cysteine desulfurase